jgi:hypothetical protein
MYPNQDELWEATDSYVNEEHSEFLRQFKKGPSWRLFYEKYIKKKVSFWQILFNMLKSFNG